ncbi:MAG: hypothetical protein EA412_03640 [Chitinophagaceae bacterium]|nr:MAG: hypothetical protein EA412_03640 [Chitinophagaceae bacterium]
MESIVIGIVSFIIIYIGISFFRFSGNKIDDYKSSRNPNDIKLQTKIGIRKIKDGNFPEAQVRFKEVIQIHPDQLEANLFLGGYNYLNKNYENATPLIKKTVLVLLPNYTPSSTKDYVDEMGAFIGLSYYFFGHIKYEEGNHDEALYWKNIALQYDESLFEDINWY